MRIKHKHLCKICGKEFETQYRTKTCSKECKNKLISLSEKDSPKVKAFHNNPDWIEKQRKFRLGRPSGRKGISPNKETKEKLSNIMIDFYKNNPKQKIERTKNANKTVRNSIGFERHNKAVFNEIKEYEKNGFVCLPIDKIRPDFLAKKDNKIFAVEVEFGSSYPEKYEKYKNFFDDIIWIKKEKK